MISKKILSVAARIVISVALILYLVFYKIDLGEIFGAIADFRLTYFVVAFLFLIAGTYFSALRWREILKTSNLNLNEWDLFWL